MNIFFDYKVFWEQSYGGVSRYFIELSKNLSNLGKILLFVLQFTKVSY